MTSKRNSHKAQTTDVKPFVMEEEELPIRQPRTPKKGKNGYEIPEWIEEAPDGAYFSPILLVRAGIYKSQVSAQVALKKWTERGALDHPSRGVYVKE